MEKKHDVRNQVLVIVSIIIATVLIIFLNVRMILNVTTRQTENLGTLQMNDIRAELQQTLDEARIQTLKIAGNIENILNEKSSTKELDAYCRKMRAELSDEACINVYCACPEWYVIPDFNAPKGFRATERDWYIGAKQNAGHVYITQPYMDLASDYVCYTVSYLLQDGKTVVSLDYSLLGIQEYITEMSEGGRTALIVTEDGKIAGYNESDQLGKLLTEVLPEYVDILELEKNNANQVVLVQTIDGVKQTVFCSKTENDWYLILCVNNSELYRESYNQFTLLCTNTFPMS